MSSTRRLCPVIAPAMVLAAMVASLASLAGCGSGEGTSGSPFDDSPPAPAQVGQTQPGGTPFIRVNVTRSSLPTTDQIHAWLFYRATSSLLAEPENIVGATSVAWLDSYEDDPLARYGVAFNTSFSFRDYSGDMADGQVQITYNDPPLVPGETYFYKLRRVVDPIRPVVPTASPAQVAPEFQVEPLDALGEPSQAIGPVTYFVSPALISPFNGSTSVNPTDLTFEWVTSAGADQYQVEVYNNPLLSRPAVYQSQTIYSGAGTVLTHRAVSSALAGSTRYWWVVGSRKLGEAQPICYINGQYRTGWIYSSPFTFTTAEGPPFPP